MNKGADVSLGLGQHATFAKFENLYGTVDEMYKSGSKQSFMTLNIQFMISQMMAILKEAPGSISDPDGDLRIQIEKHAKAFYFNYSGKQFHLIENQIGFIYCLMTLISKNMLTSAAGYEILAALSLVDNKEFFKLRQKTLDSLRPDKKSEDSSAFVVPKDLFAPDERSVEAFYSMVQKTPKVLKPIPKTAKKHVELRKDDLPIDEDNTGVERIVLKDTPFDGDFRTYFQTLIEGPLTKRTDSNLESIPKLNVTKSKESTKVVPAVNARKVGLEAFPICLEGENAVAPDVEAKKKRLEDNADVKEAVENDITDSSSESDTSRETSKEASLKE